MIKYTFILLVFAFVFTMCSPKAAKEIVIIPEPVDTSIDNPCVQFSDLRGGRLEEAENSYVLYKDLYNRESYNRALPLWRIAFTKAPKSNGKVKSHFDDGVAMYIDLIKNSEDDVQKRLYVDTIKIIHAKREECFGIDVDNVSKRAYDYYYDLREYIPTQEIYSTFKKAIALGDGKLEYYIVNPFTKLVFDGILDKSISHEEGREYADLIRASIKNGLENCEGTICEGWEVVNDYAPDRLEALEGIDGFYLCEYYNNKYFALYKSDPENCEIINRAYSRMLRGGCSENDPNVMEVKMAKDTVCYVPPPPPGTLRLAYNAYTQGDYNEAVVLFEQFATETDDPELKAKYLFLISKIYYADIKNFPQARKFALEAAKHKANWGEPYILIGKLYASSGPLCGPGRGWDSQIVTWPAIDKFAYAKSIDPSVSAEANSLIRRYNQYMPKKEDIFFRRITAGSTFRVPCWIQENTTVRTSD